MHCASLRPGPASAPPARSDDARSGADGSGAGWDGSSRRRTSRIAATWVLVRASAPTPSVLPGSSAREGLSDPVIDARVACPPARKLGGGLVHPASLTMPQR